MENKNIRIAEEKASAIKGCKVRITNTLYPEVVYSKLQALGALFAFAAKDDACPPLTQDQFWGMDHLFSDTMVELQMLLFGENSKGGYIDKVELVTGEGGKQ